MCSSLSDAFSSRDHPSIRSRVELTPASTYHKLLVHRCAAYYKLVPETESGSKVITIVIATDSRMYVGSLYFSAAHRCIV